MNKIIEQMLEGYNCHSVVDYENALKEIIQEIALLGLWRAKFFEHAAFYGGTALRILHGLQRFSEDLDFSLIKPKKNFKISSYAKAIVQELSSYDFEVEIVEKSKQVISNIDSVVIRANTLSHLIKINTSLKTHKDSVLKIKIDIDTNPPGGFETDVIAHFRPIPFSIRVFTLPDLFASKIHALTSRQRITNIKGRDWYDFLWYISRGSKFNILHLEQRLRQSKHWDKSSVLTMTDVKSMLRDKITILDIAQLKNDVAVFIENPSDLDAWSKDLFLAAIEKLN